MNKEPLGLYLLRFFTGIGLFVFMLMLYWSSLLIEQDLKSLRSDVVQIKNELPALRRAGNITTQISTNSPKNARSNAQIDPSLPNLLQEDKFYTETLPRLLPSDFKPHGALRLGTIGKPENLHPFANWSQVNDWIGLCTTSVARNQFGKFETLAPNMGLKMEERKVEGSAIPEFWVHLRDDVYWQPLDPKMFAGGVDLAPHFLQKHQVTAHDFKFYFDALMNPSNQEPGALAQRTFLEDIEQIKVIDDFTFVVRWKAHDVMDKEGKPIPKIRYSARLITGSLQPLAMFVYQYFPDGTKVLQDDANPETYRTNTVWAQNFAQHWAKNIIPSCGPWIFEEMTDRQISFRRNPDYFNPFDALMETRVYEFKNTTDAIWQDFKTLRVDVNGLQPNQLKEWEDFQKTELYLGQVKSGDGAKKINYPANAYAYIGWNEAKPYFKSKKVRQALTMAIDRNRIVSQYLKGLGTAITGGFSPHSPSYDKSVQPWPFDPKRSRLLLEKEGWYDSDGDGVLDKEIDGKRTPFSFRLTYFVKNPTTKSICEYVSTALKEVGIDCKLHGVDLADLSASMDEKSFDAYCLAWGLGSPPEDPRQLWHSLGAKQPGSSNTIGFENAEIDKIIEQLSFESDQKKRIELYHQFHRIIHEEQPYTFLYSPKASMVYREYIQNVFIPVEKQDIVPGANMFEPQPSIFWIKKTEG